MGLHSLIFCLKQLVYIQIKEFEIAKCIPVILTNKEIIHPTKIPTSSLSINQTQYPANQQNVQFQGSQHIPTPQFGSNQYQGFNQGFVPNPETQQYQQPQPTFTQPYPVQMAANPVQSHFQSHLPDQYQQHVQQPMTGPTFTGSPTTTSPSLFWSSSGSAKLWIS